ncbi:hypothetical protein [Streptomyces sp. NPDC020965]|uniref:hypothetical protein n=1 Tax=Streptomyces sp. NPDC020965 TaxID=3365105 RepID=UPI0037901919
MRLCTITPPVPRTWVVELRPRPGGPVLHCPRCAPEGQALPAVSARPAALAHLARHARRDIVPTHLRVCQCHERGCRWHPRHRGCAGPVLLVLTREHGGRIWRLSDVCAGCATATPHSAAVPDTILTAAPADPPAGRRTRTRRPRDPSAQIRVQNTLSYLAAVLPPTISPEARLLALQCALRSGRHGQVRLPAGLLRGMRLGHSPAPWRELEEHRWLYRVDEHTAPGRCFTAQLIDVMTHPPGRPDRVRAADWAQRTASQLPLRNSPAQVRLTALAVAAHHSPGQTHIRAETERLSRACGIAPSALGPLLDRLTATATIAQWSYDPSGNELLCQPSRPTASMSPEPPHPPATDLLRAPRQPGSSGKA